ncbi:ATP-binding protein [unidentified bacterial endosymbiont]|uniref:ATP-binding protein n=1 Tax=unidentified bacterial endosymbiont TaxID=2355 RepID=UPI0026463B10|nr:ATP-binding protein [unidentified bacterial endosymbiont]
MQPQRADLLELIDARYDNGATLMTSQLPVNSWYQMIGESTHADAILDRVLHSGIKLELLVPPSTSLCCLNESAC